MGRANLHAVAGVPLAARRPRGGAAPIPHDPRKRGSVLARNLFPNREAVVHTVLRSEIGRAHV